MTTDRFRPTVRPGVLRRAAAAAVLVAALVATLSATSHPATVDQRRSSAVSVAEHAVLVAAAADPRHDPVPLGLGVVLVAVGGLAIASVLAGAPASDRRHGDRRLRWRAILEGAPPVLL